MNKKSIYIGVGVLVASILGLFIFLLNQKITPESFAQNKARASVPKFISQLDGTAVTSTDAEAPQVFGVMIDNHPDARPQAGLDSARVVYEAPAEGGITRFFAIFSAFDTVEKIGPVRSARPYFLDWMKEYGAAPYVHCGGSPAALDILKTDTDLWDANQFWLDPYFWRAKNMSAPHNLYTSSELMNKFISNYGSRHTARDWQGWSFSPLVQGGLLTTSTAHTLTIAYNVGYQVQWNYNTSTNRYNRFETGFKHSMDNGQAIAADTVVVQKVAIKTLDDYGRNEIDTVSFGPAVVLRDGLVIRGTWKKQSQDARTKFYYDNGTEIPFNPGRIWVQIVPKEVVEDIK